MTKLNQILAIEKGVKNKAHRTKTEAYQTLPKTPLFSGLSKVYTPRDEEGEQLPPESQKVQFKSNVLIGEVSEALTRLFDVTATKDLANTDASADIIVDGDVLVPHVPVTTLLFLEKELEDLDTFIGKIPQLDPAQNWTYDQNAGVYKADPVETARSKKVPKNHVKYEATPEHPAQVEMYYEDIQVGVWRKVEFSGALPADRIAELKTRVDKLRTAVKFAREQANLTEVADVHIGENILGFLFSEN